MNPKPADPGPLIDPSLSQRRVLNKIISKETMEDWLVNGVPAHIYRKDPNGFDKKGYFKRMRRKKLSPPKR